MDARSKKFLQEYLDSLSPGESQKYTSFRSGYFCADEYNANICSDLVRAGVKTATCSLKHWYTDGDEEMPRVADLQVVTNWDGEPRSIIEITSVTDCRYSDVDEAFAVAEGEGDRTLAWWREAHWDFFSKECQELAIEPSLEMMLVLERFRVVHK